MSPMLLKLSSGSVDGYNEGQEPLLSFVSTIAAIMAAKIPFVFSDGHGIAAYTQWSDDINRLDQVDW